MNYLFSFIYNPGAPQENVRWGKFHVTAKLINSD
jgi:hypothetical protein